MPLNNFPGSETKLECRLHAVIQIIQQRTRVVYANRDSSSRKYRDAAELKCWVTIALHTLAKLDVARSAMIATNRA